MDPKDPAQGFTLVELLVVIAIIAILATVVMVVVNPLELTRRARDATRLSDLADLTMAINVSVQEATTSASAILCNGAPDPCHGSSNTDPSYANGTGWVKVNLMAQKSVSVPSLPVDPHNTAQDHYTYCSENDRWEIDAVLESEQQHNRLTEDGGNDPALYEVGSNLALIAPTGGSCSY